METNPYESPQSPTGEKKERKGVRLMTIAVLAMLTLLAATCIALGFVAYWLQRLA